MKFIHNLLMQSAIFVIYTLSPTDIIAEQSNLNSSTHSTNTAQQMQIAAQEGRINVLRYLIEKQKVSPDIRDKNNMTPLHCAAGSGNLSAVEYLIASGANINARESSGLIPIHFAAYQGHTHIVKFFIEKYSIDKDVQGVRNRTSLHLAAFNGKLDTVTYLIAQKADLYALDLDGVMPIHLAAINGHTHVLKHLISKSLVNKNIGSQEGKTPLHYAAQNGHLQAVKFLIQQKANINARDIHGTLPIHIAAINGHIDILTFFIGNMHIQPDALGFENLTPLHYASHNGHLTSVQYLIKQKANAKACNDNGLMSIHVAAINGHTHILKYFIENGHADKDIPGQDGQTPLFYAARNGHLPTVEYLTKLGCNIYAQDTQGIMPLHIAALEGHTHIVKYFIEQKHVDKNICGLKGRTPLHFAAEGGHITTVEYLIAQGANVKAQTEAGETALLYAWAKQHNKVIHAMTGLLVKYNEHKMLIPVPEPSHTNTATDWKKLMCINHAGQLPFFIETLAQKIAASIGVNDVFFYHTSDKRSHAHSLGFQKIGLSKRVILAGITYMLSKLILKQGTYNKPSDRHEVSFKRTLYHELCHIKANDTTTYLKENIELTDIKALTREMAAELGALYYLFAIDKKTIFLSYIADEKHPSPEEQSRYNALLYARLLDNPSADFSIVEELAQLYYQEKTTGTLMVDDTIFQVNKETL